jgi:hypothetical protein
MTLNEYCEYIGNPLAEAKTRVVTMSPGEDWTTLRRFCQERGDVEFRVSDLVRESAWLPMPAEVVGRVLDAMTAHEANGKALVLLGMPGYLALLTDENKRAAIVALREWVDGGAGREAVCLLRRDDDTGKILKEVFANPRYRQGRQLIEIAAEQIGAPTVAEEAKRVVGRTEVMLVGADLATFIPEACDTFQKYLRYAEEQPNDSSDRRIVVTSEGRPLPGLCAEVRQVVCLRDFARVFYDVDDASLSEEALRWMCGQGKEGVGKTLSETLRTLFFPEGGIAKRVLHVFDGRKGAEREAVLWLIKHAAPKESYLARFARQEGVVVSNFRSAYVTGAAEWLNESAVYASERRVAILEAGVTMSGADIRQFIARCVGESTTRLAPWLNCGSAAERAELLRRCALDGVVSQAVRVVYPETAAYLNADLVFGDATLEEYFMEYRELKMSGRVTTEFCVKAEGGVTLLSSLHSRDAMVQQYASDSGCALLVVDAMGAEWLPMLVALAREQNLGLDSLAVGEAHLPTSTQFNKIYWPDAARQLPDIKRFDNIAHNGAEKHEVRRAEENLVAALDVIGREVLPRVHEGLATFERVLVTADHGSSRLAALAWQSEPKLARTLVCDEGVDVADWRYRERAPQGACPPEMEETLDGGHWVVRGYNRLPKKGGGQGFELHGGATLEERLVPVVLFSRTGQFVPKSKISSKRVQIVEKNDFDL